MSKNERSRNSVGGKLTYVNRLAGDVSFVPTPSTLCFDLHDSAVDSAPVFILWLDGAKGADCEDAATLTLESALSVHEEWGGVTGAIAKEKKIFYRQAAGLTSTPVITLFDEPVIGS